jgi:hypothetical protein
MDSEKVLLSKLAEVLNDDLAHRVQKKKLVSSFFQQYRKLKVKDPELTNDFFSLIFTILDTKELPESVVRYASDRGIPFGNKASFRELITTDTVRRRLSAFQPSWLLNDKKRGLKFAEMVGVPGPNIISESFAIKDIDLVYPCVVKPMSSSASKGVYIAVSDTFFKCVKTGECIHSLSELIVKMTEDLKKGVVAQDVWQTEELVADIHDDDIVPARDLKFYCFYGEVGMVLEVERSSGAKLRPWYPNGEQADAGDFVSQESFERTYFTQENIELVKKFSSEIPFPFISIDFLKTNNKMVFGEFTPRPGLYDKFNASFDNYLGECYLKSEARLQKDLLSGKKFSVFNEFIKSCGGF